MLRRRAVLSTSMGSPEHVLRFAIVDGEGRTSAAWRAWTGSSRPSDEVYLAPRAIGGDLKISVHADGYSQLGPTRTVRDKLFRTDRHAVSRWSIDMAASPCMMAGVSFHRSELRKRNLPSGVVAVEMPADVAGVLLLLATNLTGTFPWGDGLPSRTTTMSLGRRTLPPVTALFVPLLTVHPGLEGARLRSLIGPTGIPWELPVHWTEKTFGWAVMEDDRFPQLLEIAYDQESPPDFPHSLSEFNGTIEPWENLPIQPSAHIDLCAVIVVRDGDGLASLFINVHSRCKHDQLACQANGVLTNFHEQGPDDGWNHDDTNEVWFTGMVTRTAHDRLASASE
jgi:hypothetical protein